MKSASQTLACAAITAILLTACAKAGPPQIPCEGLTCEGGPCTSDFDCQVGQLCDQGECVEGEDQTPCQADSDCAFGEVCDQGICALVEGFCNRNSDCANGELCDRDSRRCIATDERPCQTRQDCFSDEACIDNLCQSTDMPDVGVQDVVDPTPDPEPTPEPSPEPDPQPEPTPDPEPEPQPDVVEPPQDVPQPPMDADMEDTGLEDALEDAPEDVPEPEDAEEDTGEPLPTPGRGIYSYDRLPVGGLEESAVVQFHPTGDYALILERNDVIHVFDWATQRATRHDLRPPGANIYWEDMAFDPSGDFALLVGRLIDDGVEQGVIFRFDDGAWRGQQELELIFTQYGFVHPVPFRAIEYPWEGGDPILLTSPARSPYNATLRGFDPELGAFTDFVTAQFSSAGCDDIAFANNAFDQPGILVACGRNGADVLYYTELDGIGMWTVDPGNNNLGNTSSVAAHPGGDYALVLSFSGRALYRFDRGLLNDYGDAPRFSRLGVTGVSFQPNGRRALIFGRAGISPVRGTLIEYRHDAYACPNAFANCELTEVSIPNFEAPPFNGSRDTNLNDAAFHPHCDGGLIVGGESDFNGSAGTLIRFQIEGQGTLACP